MNLFNLLIDHINQIGAIALFIIGLYTVITHNHLIKRVFGINIMGTAVFLFFVSIGYVKEGVVPIYGNEEAVYVNPLPSVLILTGIVVVVSITVYALGLVVKIYEGYGTLDQVEISEKMSEAMRDD